MTEILDRPKWQDDGLVTDRVRSAVGPLVKRLDQPHVHVMSTRGEVRLDGDVSDHEAKAAIEAAARRVPGVVNVTSRLHVGLRRGECTPSVGRRTLRSALFHRLESAARSCGYATPQEARHVLHGALRVFAAVLPEPQRRRFLQHLPADVRRMSVPGAWATADVRSISSQRDLVATVAAATHTDRTHMGRLLTLVLPLLRRHAPEDADAIADVLSPELRALWLRGAVDTKMKARFRGDPLNAPVSAYMTRNVVRVPPRASLLQAFDLMSRTGVRHLPVVDFDGRCLDILSAFAVARRLPEAWATADVATSSRAGAVGPLSVLPETRLVDAASAMDHAGVDACCIVDDRGRFLGLLTARDVVAAVAMRPVEAVRRTDR